MAAQPTGTVTLLFTDIEGSTRLLERLGTERYGKALELHRQLLRDASERHDGYEVDCEGDSFFVAFAGAQEAVSAAAEAQQALAAAEWPDGGPIRVRMGLHTGEPLAAPPKYVGLDVHKAARIMAAGHGGQVLVSSATERLVEGIELVHMGEHRLKDLLQPEPLYQLRVAGLPSEFPALKTLGNRPTNLPVQPTPLVGRDDELRRVSELLTGPGVRLLTLTGPGGIGKTRLALQAAAELLEEFASGVFFVSLATLDDPALVIAAVAQTLAVRERPGEEIARTLADYLERKQMLIVLDNFEHVIDAAPQFAAVLERCPDLKLLVTSRERVGLRAELQHEVPPLGSTDAAGLFVTLARRFDERFEPDEHVAEIARRLDGLPLAIELAAARVKVLTTAQIQERLRESLDTLTGGGRDLPERQRTLRATLRWSYDLLAPAEATLLARLGVFPGSFDLAAAEAVVDAGMDPLQGLVEKSLLRHTAGERFFMLETIGQFARELLSDLDEAAALRRRHAAYFAELAEERDEGTRDARQRESVRLLRLDQANLRAALDTLSGLEDARPQARLVATLAYFWYLTAQFGEAILRARAAYDRLGNEHVAERAAVANALALLSGPAGDVGAARGFATEALELSRRVGDEAATLRALTGVASAACTDGDWELMRSSLQEQIALAESSGARWYLALGLANLAVLHRELGDLDRSRESAVRAAEMFDEVGDPHCLAGAACNAAHADLLTDRFEDAQRRFTDALVVIAEQPPPEMVVWCLDGLAAVEARSGDAAHAARLLGAAGALAAATGYAHPGTAVELRATRDAIAARIGAAQADALGAEGAGLGVTAAIELALTDAVSLPGTGG